MSESPLNSSIVQLQIVNSAPNYCKQPGRNRDLFGLFKKSTQTTSASQKEVVFTKVARLFGGSQQTKAGLIHTENNNNWIYNKQTCQLCMSLTRLFIILYFIVFIVPCSMFRHNVFTKVTNCLANRHRTTSKLTFAPLRPYKIINHQFSSNKELIVLKDGRHGWFVEKKGGWCTVNIVDPDTAAEKVRNIYNCTL